MDDMKGYNVLVEKHGLTDYRVIASIKDGHMTLGEIGAKRKFYKDQSDEFMKDDWLQNRYIVDRLHILWIKHSTELGRLLVKD